MLEDNILEVKTNIRRNKINREMMEVCSNDGRLAISRFTVQTVYDLGKNQKLSLVSCEIETGRTHQIRVHAKLIECPIVGDNLYKLRRKEDVGVKKTILPLLDGKKDRGKCFMRMSCQLFTQRPEKFYFFEVFCHLTFQIFYQI